jgi:hypothetical protein
MIERLPENSSATLGFRVSGKLHDADFQQTFLPAVAAAAERGDVGILIQFADDFAGWDLHALWDEVSYHTRYARNIKRMALVGDARWQEWLARLSRPLPSLEVRYFPAVESAAAWGWLETNRDSQA